MGFALVGDVEEAFYHGGDVALGGGGKAGEMSDFGDVLRPSWMARVDGAKRFADGFAARDVVAERPIGSLVGGADQKLAAPIAGVGERVEFVDHQVLETAVSEGIA